MATFDVPPVDDIPFVGDQIAEQDQQDAAKARRARRSKLLRPLMWRLHFIGGILAGPVVISLAVTGILYAWAPQLDGLRFGSIIEPTSHRVNVTMADQVKAAQAAHPSWAFVSVIPGYGVGGSNDLNTAVTMDPTHGKGDGYYDNYEVFVDQATGKVTGQIKMGNLSTACFGGCTPIGCWGTARAR